MTAAGGPKSAISGFLLGEERAIQNLKAKMLKSGIFVSFEPFCGNTKPVERPESRVEEVKDKRRRHDGAFKVGKEVS